MYTRYYIHWGLFIGLSGYLAYKGHHSELLYPTGTSKQHYFWAPKVSFYTGLNVHIKYC